MPRTTGHLPWDCIVPGVPASVGGSATKRADWKSRVAAAAAASWAPTALLSDEQVALTVVVFGTDLPGDVDNKIKHTQDGLIGAVLVDDDVVAQVTAVRVDLRDPVTLRAPSPVLAGGLTTFGRAGGPFVYLRVTPPRPLEELLT